MSSFFTVPASQRKRKRDNAAVVPSKERTTSTRSRPKTQNTKPTRPKRDESISSSGSEDDTKRRKLGGGEEEEVSSSDSDEEDETGAERRLRLAERYLENIKGEVDEVGFDAEEIDKDLIAERLQEDVVRISKVFLPL